MQSSKVSQQCRTRSGQFTTHFCVGVALSQWWRLHFDKMDSIYLSLDKILRRDYIRRALRSRSMAKDKFHEMYPNYELIPEKGSKLTKALGRVAVGVGLIVAAGVTFFVLQKLGQASLPVPNVAGVNKFSATTALNLAKQQVEVGDFRAATLNFRNYFAWGGKDPEAMDLYSKALNALGLQSEAKYWKDQAQARVKALETK